MIEESPGAGNKAYSEEVREQQMKEMVRRDRNHPAIMFWSLGSGSDHTVSSKYVLAEDTTRIVTARRAAGGSAGASVKHTYDDIVFTELKHYPSAGEEDLLITAQEARSGEPAKIALSGSHKKTAADRGSVVVVSAEVVDSKGVRVKDASNTLKWEVTGPAKLAGPSVFESDKNMYRSAEGASYLNIPVPNVIRLTGKTGKVKVTVSASGLASGTFELDASEIRPDNTVITEPLLNDEGRRPVARAVLVIERLEEVPQEVKEIVTDFNSGTSDKQGYVKSIRAFIHKNHPFVDTATIEFRTLVNVFASYLNNNNGLLTASDFNYNVAHYNNCRLISGYINATKLPPLFKETLRKYYSDAVIVNGSEKNAGDEMNWMNWIPSGGTVIISQESDINNWPKGTLITSKDELPDLISAVYPVFAKYSEEARERALTFVSKMNPYVHQEQGPSGIIYRAERGKPVLIPLQKFISQ